MTEQAGIEDFNVNINFQGHPPEEITLQQVALGLRPALLVSVSEDVEGAAFNFDVEAYGTEDLRGFLETVIAVLGTLIEQPLEFAEAGVPDADQDAEADG